MAGIPISIEKIKCINERPGWRVDSSDIKVKEVEETKFLVKIITKDSQLPMTYIADYKELLRLKENIDEVFKKLSTADILNVSKEQGADIDQHYLSDELCKNCKYKLSRDCITCLMDLQSPLERKLFLELKSEYISFIPQYALDWSGENISVQGKSYDNPENNYKNVLTVVDFFIQKRKAKLCVYTDGHTYHERTEEQAQKDRRIDRRLQELGYQVLRYTGKDVNENMDRIIRDIKNWIN